VTYAKLSGYWTDHSPSNYSSMMVQITCMKDMPQRKKQFSNTINITNFYSFSSCWSQRGTLVLNNYVERVRHQLAHG